MAQKISYGGVTIIVHRTTVRDDLHAQIITQQLQQAYPIGEYGFWETFGDLVSSVTRAEGLKFDPCHLHEASADAIRDAYEQFLGLDKKLRDRWKKALDAANETGDEVSGPEPVEDAGPNA